MQWQSQTLLDKISMAYFNLSKISEDIDYRKYRLTYEGGQPFIDEYLEKFSKLEDDADFNQRKKIAYSPSYAKAAVNEIINGIFQRLVDVSRKGGDITYQQSIAGENKGVDLKGNSMRSFLGRCLLPELIPIGKVGILVDRPAKKGRTLADPKASPYLVVYRAEDIVNVSYDDLGQIQALQLKRTKPTYYDGTTFIRGEEETYITLVLKGDKVKYTEEDKDGKRIDTRTLDLNFIPFVLSDLRTSLLKDVANYQIAMLNASSSDLNYILKANFPFYTEQQQVTVPNATKDKQVKTVKTGPTQGRSYAPGLERPGFIHPSAEPIKASMDKHEQMKKEVRELVNLAVENLGQDKGLEAGLSYIGLELERVEKEISKYWAFYMGEKVPATVTYPNTYDLETDEERFAKTEQLVKLRKEVPSVTYKKEITKRIAEVTLNKTVNVDTLNTIYDEIDAAEVIIVDPESLLAQHEAGLVGDELASLASGFPKGEFKKAQEDRNRRMDHMLASQSAFAKRGLDNAAARGAKDIPEGETSKKMEKKVAEETN